MEIQYSKLVDALVYSSLTKDFTQKDWLALTEAARDQAIGLTLNADPLRENKTISVSQLAHKEVEE